MKFFQTKKLNNKKVDFIITSTQKGATSASDKYLRDHNDICMASRKEVHFFNIVF